jgi:hypothetical protein
MTALHLHVPFAGKLPPIPLIVAQLNLLAQEAVYYEEARWQLSCPVMPAEFGLYPGQENQYILTSFAGKPTYLVDATLVVLTALGGSYSTSLPEWAKQPWQVAKPYYERQLP